MSRLKGLRCYLVGPIDAAIDAGIIWRRGISLFLKNKVGVIPLDPTDKPLKGFNEISEVIAYRKELKAQGRFSEVKDLMKRIRSIDLRMCDVCDFAIIYIDLSIPMCGTWEEIFWCNRMKKPCLVVCEQGKNKIPDWLFGTIPDDYMFSTFDDVKAFLRNVAYGDFVDKYNRWVFFNFE